MKTRANPVTKVPIQTITKKNIYKNKAGCLMTESDINPVSVLCTKANKVQLIEKSFEPDWGLYNGSMDTGHSN